MSLHTGYSYVTLYGNKSVYKCKSKDVGIKTTKNVDIHAARQDAAIIIIIIIDFIDKLRPEAQRSECIYVNKNHKDIPP